jgi:hypothetical protein
MRHLVTLRGRASSAGYVNLRDACPFEKKSPSFSFSLSLSPVTVRPWRCEDAPQKGSGVKSGGKVKKISCRIKKSFWSSFEERRRRLAGCCWTIWLRNGWESATLFYCSAWLPQKKCKWQVSTLTKKKTATEYLSLVVRRFSNFVRTSLSFCLARVMSWVRVLNEKDDLPKSGKWLVLNKGSISQLNTFFS